MWRYVYGIMLALATLGTVTVGGNGRIDPVPCEEARLKCAYRTGCGRALQNYLMGCSAVLQGNAETYCPESCQHALIALTSTDEGQDLMTCECSDDFCYESKRRVEVCRPEVIIATRNETVVSCRIAQWICAADAECSTALEYYHRNCRSMFLGKKCTRRCLNSISILQRQEKAAKLNSCKCDGNEDYNCAEMQTNMAWLCFHQKPTEATTTTTPTLNNESNEINSAHRLECTVLMWLTMVLFTFIT